MDGENRPQPLGRWAMAATAGSTLVGCSVAGIVLDLQLGWTPWATLIGLILGAVSCMSILIRAANRANDGPADGGEGP
jgi:F0F1-type ATP synthase assembly protein I